jgi:hypothetical protein
MTVTSDDSLDWGNHPQMAEVIWFADQGGELNQAKRPVIIL